MNSDTVSTYPFSQKRTVRLRSPTTHCTARAYRVEFRDFGVNAFVRWPVGRKMMLLISSSVTPCGVPSKRCFRKINSKVAAATNAKSSFIHRRRGTRDALRTNALFSPDTDDCKREECSVPNPPASCLDPGLNSDLLSSADCALSVAKMFSRNEQWIEYQNPNRYWEQMASIGGSVVARRVTLPAVILATWALGVNEVRDFEALEQLSNATPFVQVIGGAMTLLLGTFFYPVKSCWPFNACLMYHLFAFPYVL